MQAGCHTFCSRRLARAGAHSDPLRVPCGLALWAHGFTKAPAAAASKSVAPGSPNKYAANTCVLELSVLACTRCHSRSYRCARQSMSWLFAFRNLCMSNGLTVPSCCRWSQCAILLQVDCRSSPCNCRNSNNVVQLYVVQMCHSQFG